MEKHNYPFGIVEKGGIGSKPLYDKPTEPPPAMRPKKIQPHINNCIYRIKPAKYNSSHRCSLKGTICDYIGYQSIKDCPEGVLKK